MRKKLILIVEDELEMRKALFEGLSSNGYSISLSESAETALPLFDQKPFDLVISDIRLPDRDGLQLLDALRERSPQTPVMLMTGFGTIQNAVEAMRKGAFDYLVKPFEFNELLARIRALLRRPKAVLPDELKISDLTLNPATKKVYRAGKEILLTLKEFRLLEYFMRNAGITLTREDILNNLWDYEFDSFSNVVDVHVKNLRKKIDSNYKEKLFQTVWGVGYKIKN